MKPRTQASFSHSPYETPLERVVETGRHGTGVVWSYVAGAAGQAGILGILVGGGKGYLEKLYDAITAAPKFIYNLPNTIRDLERLYRANLGISDISQGTDVVGKSLSTAGNHLQNLRLREAYDTATSSQVNQSIDQITRGGEQLYGLAQEVDVNSILNSLGNLAENIYQRPVETVSAALTVMVASYVLSKGIKFWSQRGQGSFIEKAKRNLGRKVFYGYFSNDPYRMELNYREILRAAAGYVSSKAIGLAGIVNAFTVFIRDGRGYLSKLGDGLTGVPYIFDEFRNFTDPKFVESATRDLKTLSTATSNIQTGVTAVQSGISSMQTGANTIQSSLGGTLEQLFKGQVDRALQELQKSGRGLEQLQAGLKPIQTGIEQVMTSAQEIHRVASNVEYNPVWEAVTNMSANVTQYPVETGAAVVTILGSNYVLTNLIGFLAERGQGSYLDQILRRLARNTIFRGYFDNHPEKIV